jgi:hypothetical protein
MHGYAMTDSLGKHLLLITAKFILVGVEQGWPLGGASGALALGANFEGALKRRSPTGHTYVAL